MITPMEWLRLFIGMAVLAIIVAVAVSAPRATGREWLVACFSGGRQIYAKVVDEPPSCGQAYCEFHERDSARRVMVGGDCLIVPVRAGEGLDIGGKQTYLGKQEDSRK